MRANSEARSCLRLVDFDTTKISGTEQPRLHTPGSAYKSLRASNVIDSKVKDLRGLELRVMITQRRRMREK